MILQPPPGPCAPCEPDEPPFLLPNAAAVEPDLPPLPGQHKEIAPAHGSESPTRNALTLQPAHSIHEGPSSGAGGSGAPHPQGGMEAWLRSLDGKLDNIAKAVREMREDRKKAAFAARSARQSIVAKGHHRLHLSRDRSTPADSRATTSRSVESAISRSAGPIRSETPGRAGTRGEDLMARRLAKAHAGSASRNRPQGEGQQAPIAVLPVWTGSGDGKAGPSATPVSSPHCSRATPPAAAAEDAVAQRDADPGDPGEARTTTSSGCMVSEARKPLRKSMLPGLRGSSKRKEGASQASSAESSINRRSIASTMSSTMSSKFSKVKRLMTGIFEDEDFEDNDRRGSSKDQMMQDKISRQLTIMRNPDERKKFLDLKSIVKHRFFEITIMIVVLLNALTIGAQTDILASSEGDASAAGWHLDFFATLDHVCTIIFTLELAVRILVFKRDFFTNPTERNWNMFDTLLVLVSMADIIISSVAGEYRGHSLYDLSWGKTLRVLRMARLLRVLRMVRFVSELRVMLQMIATSLQSLFWVLVIMFMVIYVFSIILTTGATEYLRAERAERPGKYSQMKDSFGGIFETMYTLYKAMSGGVDWGDVSSLLRETGWAYEAVLICYTFFTIFAVINIVTGVFVDGAIELAKRDRTMIMQKRVKEQKTHEADMLALMHTMGIDGDGTISKSAFKEALEREEVMKFISAMQVEVSDAGAFFNLLDTSGDGLVDISEFVSGMLKLRGEARSVDVAMMMLENRKMLRTVAGLVGILGESLEDEGCDEVDEGDDQGDGDKYM